jgi:general secretion pathway protein A
MYENYYNIKAMPFQITTDPRFLWLGEKHSEALATLKYGVLENKGFLLLTGDVGTGKTALINRLVRNIDVAAIVAKIPDPGLSSMDFFNFLAVEFKMEKKFDTKGQFLILLRRFLHAAYLQNKRVLLIIDEAQRLTPDLLEDIRLLSNIELQNRKLINIFFVGQPEFNELLMEDRNRAVRQRIAVSYHIKPLSEIEANQYIKHRLKVAGATREIFSKNAVSRIHTFSKGYPRLINIMCDHAMLTGYAAGLKTITEKVIRECERELRIPLEFAAGNGKDHPENTTNRNKDTDPQPNNRSTKRRTGMIAAMIMLLVFGVYIFTNQKFDEALGLKDDFLRWADELLRGADDAPRWKLEEKEPQKDQGPSPEELEKDHSDKVQMGELKDDKLIKETPEGAKAMRKNVQSPAYKNIDGTENRQSLDENTAGKQTQQPTVIDKNPEKTNVNETPEAAPLLERKFIVHFKYNSNELPEKYFGTLNRIADFMLKRPASSIVIKGYSDSIGSDDYNLSVSRFRANTIKTFLVGKGVDTANIKTIALGSKDPIATNTTVEGRSKNRRVELELIRQN